MNCFKAKLLLKWIFIFKKLVKKHIVGIPREFSKGTMAPAGTASANPDQFFFSFKFSGKLSTLLKKIQRLSHHQKILVY